MAKRNVIVCDSSGCLRVSCIEPALFMRLSGEIASRRSIVQRPRSRLAATSRPHSPPLIRRRGPPRAKDFRTACGSSGAAARARCTRRRIAKQHCLDPLCRHLSPPPLERKVNSDGLQLQPALARRFGQRLPSSRGRALCRGIRRRLPFRRGDASRAARRRASRSSPAPCVSASTHRRHDFATPASPARGRGGCSGSTQLGTCRRDPLGSTLCEGSTLP